MRWELIPSWWKKTAKEVPSTFNARAETVAQKPMFRSAFKRSRCIVPASGYYEWRPVEGSKQPYFISAADDGVLSIAGLWDQWKDPESGEAVSSAALIVAAAMPRASEVGRAADLMSELHGHPSQAQPQCHWDNSTVTPSGPSMKTSLRE
jgi:putative SOS response-associated peptidase YedK